MVKLFIPAMLAGILPLCSLHRLFAKQPGGVGRAKIWYVTAPRADLRRFSTLANNKTIM